MRISTKDWLNYIQKMRKLSDAAADAMQKYVQTHGFGNTDELIDYAYALVTKYGEGAAALACQMYDETAALSGEIVDAAVPAETATYEKTAQAIEGSLLQSPTGQKLTQVASRLVKQAASDTTLQNAVRDGAWFAWVPSGDSCPYCMMLGAIGWQRAGETTLNGRHARHIHANCDCQYVVDLKGDMKVSGYDPTKLQKQMLEACNLEDYGIDYDINSLTDGEIERDFERVLNADEKGLLNASRRLFYQDNKIKILEQKKAAYAKRTGKEVRITMSDSDTAKLAELRKKYKTLENSMLFGTAEDAAEFKRLLEVEKSTTTVNDFDKLFNQQSNTEKSLISWRDEPNLAEKDAISTYTSSQYKEINGYLRNGDYATPKTKEEIETLHKYLESQITKEDIYLKRGYSTGNPEKRLGEFKNGNISSIVGNIITDKGFVSTTAFNEGGFGGNVIMYIKAPKGTKGAYISDLSRKKDEKEFLLDCNQSFIIKDAKKKNNEYGFEIIEVFCEVIT